MNNNGQQPEQVETMKTQEQLIERYQQVADNDFFGAKRGDLAKYMTRESLAAVGAPVSDDQAHLIGKPLTRDAVLAEMHNYMTFAWDKANNERGLSAGRSINHFEAWLWLLGDEEALAFAEDAENYPDYGRPILHYICERFGFPVADESAEVV